MDSKEIGEALEEIAEVAKDCKGLRPVLWQESAADLLLTAVPALVIALEQLRAINPEGTDCVLADAFAPLKEVPESARSR